MLPARSAFAGSLRIWFFSPEGYFSHMSPNIVTAKSVGFWVAERMGGSFCSDEAVAIGLERHGKLIAGTIFEQWNGRSMVCHMAVDGLMTPEYLRSIAEYAFKT